MVAGDVVNTASRLQSQAPEGSILVGEETYRGTRTIIDYEPVEPIVAKGKQLPVAAWRVVSAARPPGERGASNVPMIGRESELATLTSLWERVEADRKPHLATIVGLPGIGKSRLAREFIDVVGTADARAIVGRSLPYGESGAYGAFAQQVKQIAGIYDGDAPDGAGDKLRASVADVVGTESADEVSAHLSLMLGLEAAPSDGAVTDRHVLFFSARRFVEGLGRAAPTVLVFQDLHWADASLLDLIEILASRLEDTPVLLLVLARPELRDKRPAWGSTVQAALALPLEPLDRAHADELAGLLADAAGSVPSAAAEIGRTAEGNPLFIEELVASMAERSSQAGSELPTSVRGIIAARLDAIPPAERSLLLDASVMGRIFWSGGLTGLGQAAESLPAVMDSLEGRDLIRREPVSRYQGEQQFRFKHALIRDVAYATLPRARRREAHEAVATFLESVHAERDSPSTLAHHWEEAGDLERAIGFYVAAAEQASRGWAKEEAVDLLRRALSLVQQDDRERFRKLRLKLFVAEQMLYHVPDAQALARDRTSEPQD